jgi:hypothetical protein
MHRVREEIFWIVVLLSGIIGLVDYMGTTTPDSPADNPHPLIQSFELDVCSAYKINYHGEKILINCHGF